MHTLSEIVRLSAQGLSDRQIARSVRLSRTTVMRYLERTRAAGISWPLPPGMTEAKLLELVTPKSLSPEREEPDFAAVHRELSSRRFATLRMWHAVEVFVDLHVVIDVHFCLAPLRKLEPIKRQLLQRWPVDFVK